MPRFLLTALLASFVCLPVAALGQSAEEDEREVLKPGASAPELPKLADLEATAKSIIRQTNAFRENEGLAKVEPDAELGQAAQYFADFMARTDKYGHTADGNRPADRAKEHGYDYCIVLENIAYHYSSAGFTADKLADQAFTGWKQSPGHRKNMLDPDVTQTAVALARSDNTGYYYAVQMFGRPRQDAIEFSVANETAATVEYTLGSRDFTLPPRLTRTHMRCRPSKVTFHWPEPAGEAQTTTPKNGDELRVVKVDDRFRVQR